MQGTNRSGEEGGRACYVTPDLSYYKEGQRKWDGKIIIKKKKHVYSGVVARLLTLFVVIILGQIPRYIQNPYPRLAVAASSSLR